MFQLWAWLDFPPKKPKKTKNPPTISFYLKDLNSWSKQVLESFPHILIEVGKERLKGILGDTITEKRKAKTKRLRLRQNYYKK